MASRQLTVNTMSPLIKKAQYAVRGKMVQTAEDIANDLKAGKGSYPFDEVVFCNVGNPQALKQQPISFYRQVLCLLEYPALIESGSSLFASDVVDRARRYLDYVPSVGAYSHSQGIHQIRESVAEFIEKRDGFPADPEDIFLTDGASPGVQSLIRMLLRDEKDGIMIPIPQYPLYSAAIPLYGGSQVNYYLDESKGWGLSIDELSRSYKEATSDGVNPRALCVINPGNPTGQTLSPENMKEILKWCAENRLVLMADEVYQENIYVDGAKFHSFKKVLREMDSDVQERVELVSFHSVSKGIIGECGKRGGYFELVNIDPEVKAQLYKLVSICLCPNVLGQFTVALMVDPPKEGEPSYEQFEEEKNGIFDSLKRRAEMVVSELNKLEGVTCNPSEGALYAFPQITLPPKAVEAAEKAGENADQFYCLELLKNTGICVIPGSGFGQRDGTFHFRTTILPQEEQLTGVMERLGKFHGEFVSKYQ